MGRTKKETSHESKTSKGTTKEIKAITSTRKDVKEKDRRTRAEDRRIAKEIEREKIALRNLQWIESRIKAGRVPIYTADFETDPFCRGKVPKPFVLGFYDGIQFKYFWGSSKRDCVEQFRDYLETSGLEPGIIYFHNGGRFDFFYILDFFEGKSMIIQSRIVCAYMPIGSGKKRLDSNHRFEFRDSFAIMPFALAAYKKRKLPIKYLSREKRDAHRRKVLYYLEGDCIYLWELVMQFQEEFGDYKTIASAAFKQLTGFHRYETLPLRQDEIIRKDYYFGGRVQCFQKGLMDIPVEIYDVNSMYPFVMDNYFHPTGWITSEGTKVTGWNPDGTLNAEKEKTFFISVEGENFGAFPVRKKDGSVDFTESNGIFHVSIHEYLVALQLHLFRQRRIINVLNFKDYTRFHLFVDHFYRAREKAKLERDAVRSLFYKFILNSAYGKFGLNPENYYNWQITKENEQPEGKYWELDSIAHDRYFIWKQPSQLSWNVKNIGTASSITGAARSILLRAIAQSENVLYCDTDSIICKKFEGGMIDDSRLGAWKLEGKGKQAAIAGKKMYAIFDENGKCIKHANKGVDISPEQIRQISNGEEVLTWRESPTFKRDGTATFVHRTVRMT